jgi:hypothetical protein
MLAQTPVDGSMEARSVVEGAHMGYGSADALVQGFRRAKLSDECVKQLSGAITKDWNCTKYSRQRRHVQRDLPLRTPQRASGKSERSQGGASGPDIGTTTSLRQPPPAAPAKDGFGRFIVNAPCCVDLL